MKHTTRLQTQLYVRAFQLVAGCELDHVELEGLVTQEECDCYDDNKIGGKNRNQLASIIKRLRHNPVFRTLLKNGVEQMEKLYRREGIDKHKTWPRYFPKTVTRKAKPATTHRDCCYCGYGYSTQVCGVCRESGIDGPVIRGTTAVKSSTSQKWSKN